ncbi:MAG: RNA polymerase sigma-70 factor [Williamsia sp.]|nr:RNA polymerase sigma-70 factor [Williamsia sp.]
MSKSADIPSSNPEFSNASYEALFRASFVPLCAFYKFKFGFSSDTAKELVHIGFIKLWENRDKISAASAKAYLQKTITNASLDLIKHEKVKQRHIQHVLASGAAEQMEGESDNIDYKQLSADIQQAIARLPQQMRRIFELSRNEGLKYAEIAAQLQISVKTVDTQMSRALAKLRNELSRYLILLLLALLFRYK